MLEVVNGVPCEFHTSCRQRVSKAKCLDSESGLVNLCVHTWYCPNAVLMLQCLVLWRQ